MTEASLDLDRVRRRILEHALVAAPAQGWTGTMLRRAAKDAAVPAGHDKLAFPQGAQDLIHFYSQELDLELVRRLDGTDLDGMRVRDRIAFAVRARIELLEPDREAAKRAAAILALPPNALLAAQLIYETADAIWHGIGDRSTDINFYSKRAILAGVYSSTLLFWFGDDSPDAQASWAFLSRRIENVMRFETVKAQARKVTQSLPSPWRMLGALRYAVRR